MQRYVFFGFRILFNIWLYFLPRIPRKEAMARNKKETPIPQSTIHTIVFCNRNSLDTSGLIRFAIPNNKKKLLINKETIIITVFFRLEVFIMGNFMILNLVTHLF